MELMCWVGFQDSFSSFSCSIIDEHCVIAHLLLAQLSHDRGEAGAHLTGSCFRSMGSSVKSTCAIDW